MTHTHTEPFLEPLSLRLFTEIYASSPSYSILLEFCSQPGSCTSPHSFPRQTCQLINVACIPYSLTCDLQQLMLCLAPSFWVIQTIAVMFFLVCGWDFFFLADHRFLSHSYWSITILLSCSIIFSHKSPTFQCLLLLTSTHPHRFGGLMGFL